MNVAATAHGFRSTFRDWVSERTDYSGEVAEMALAHAIGDKVEAAYRRGDLLAKRVALMADWASFLEGSRKAARNAT
jgi:integrase